MLFQRIGVSCEKCYICYVSVLKGVAGFKEWYSDAQNRLKTDELTPLFVEIRNDVVHVGENPLNKVTLEHLRFDLGRQMHDRSCDHVIVLPDPNQKDATVLVNAVDALTEYITSLVSIVFDCYEEFKTTVDPQWYLTEESFAARGKNIEDALEELGYPRGWLACAPEGPDT